MNELTMPSVDSDDQRHSADPFTLWGTNFCRLWVLGAYACLIVALAYAIASSEPFLTRLLTVIILGIVPACAMLSIGIVVRAFFSCASWCYRRSEPTIDILERACLAESKRLVGVVRSSHISSPIAELGHWALYVGTSPVRFIARMLLMAAAL